MDHPALPDYPDLAQVLPRDAYYLMMHTLRASLPPPPGDQPDAVARRDNAAIAQIAGLLPVNAAEANLAAQFVAANAQALACLKEARDYAADSAWMLKCSAQAASMMRQAQGAMRTLLQLQAARRAVEANPQSADQAAWTEHCAAGFMSQALREEPSAKPQPATAAAADDAPPIDPVAEAESYAVHYPQRAALIRSLGRLPDNPSFGPPEDYLVQALVHGTTPALIALDTPPD